MLSANRSRRFSSGAGALALAWTMAHAASAATITASSPILGLRIPDDSSTGVALALEIPESATIDTLQVTLGLSVPAGSTGWAGDLYAYLLHDTTQSILLNRPGRRDADPAGYDDSFGIEVTFDDAALDGDIHAYRLAVAGDHAVPWVGDLTGLWQPDGRATDPGLALDGDPRTALLGAFQGQDAAGTWSLFIADLSGGGEFQIDQWSIRINDGAPIPEPTHTGLLALLPVAGFLFVTRRKRRSIRG